MSEKIKIAVLVSGGGTNLQALIDAEKSGIIKSGHIVRVISNKPARGGGGDPFGDRRFRGEGSARIRERAARMP